MAIRYAGDFELRLQYKQARRSYFVKVRHPGIRIQAFVMPASEVRGSLTRKFYGRSNDSSETYDLAAAAALRHVVAVLRRRGQRVKIYPIRRTFIAPCPIRVA